MFGHNPIRSIETTTLALAIESMFYTIQGEGPLSGMPALFIRLAGCNLACHFCDTQFETQADKPRGVSAIIEEINRRFTPHQRRLVVMTGGEPMRQNWSTLAYWLLKAGTNLIQVETAGTLWQPDLAELDDSIVYVCSPKTPGVRPEIAERCRHWKYIVRAGEESEEDGLPMRGTQLATMDKTQKLYRPIPDPAGRRHAPTIWLSPCDENTPTRNQSVNTARARDLCLRHGYRLSLQMHKIIGVE